MRSLFPSSLTSTDAVSAATTELPDFGTADAGAVLGAFGIAGACGTAAVALGGAGILAVTFGGCGIAALGGVTTSVSTVLGTAGDIAGAAGGAAGTGIAIGFGAVIAATAGTGFAVAVAPTAGFEIDGAFGTTGTIGNFGAVGLGTAATEACGFGGGAVGRLAATPFGNVSCERGVDVGGAKSCPGARAALPGTKLADPCRRSPASVGAGPNLSSTLKSTMMFGLPK